MFDRSAILRRAWGFYRASFNFPPTSALSHRARLSRAMRNAWAEAKRLVAEAAAEAARAARFSMMTPETRATFAALATLEAKERWTDGDRAQAGALRRQLAEAS